MNDTNTLWEKKMIPSSKCYKVLIAMKTAWTLISDSRFD